LSPCGAACDCDCGYSPDAAALLRLGRRARCVRRVPPQRHGCKCFDANIVAGVTGPAYRGCPCDCTAGYSLDPRGHGCVLASARGACLGCYCCARSAATNDGDVSAYEASIGIGHYLLEPQLRPVRLRRRPLH
jgi:hypothetical protein